MGFLDIIDPAIDSVKKLLKMDSNKKTNDVLEGTAAADDNYERQLVGPFSDGNDQETDTGFDLDAFVSERLSLDPSKLDFLVETARTSLPARSSGKVYKRPFPSR